MNMFWRHYLENKKPTFLACIPTRFMLPFWNLQRITIFFRAAKPTLAESLKFPWHSFYKAATVREKKEDKRGRKVLAILAKASYQL